MKQTLVTKIEAERDLTLLVGERVQVIWHKNVPYSAFSNPMVGRAIKLTKNHDRVLVANSECLVLDDLLTDKCQFGHWVNVNDAVFVLI